MLSAKTLAFFVAAAISVRADITVTTPKLVQCESAHFEIGGSDTGPFYGFVVKADDPCGDALKEIEGITGNSLDWVVNVPAGQKVMLGLENDAGVEGWSGAVEIESSDDDSCLTAADSSSTVSRGSTATTSARVSTNTNTQADTPANAEQNPEKSSAFTVGAGASSALAVFSAVIAALSF